MCVAIIMADPVENTPELYKAMQIIIELRAVSSLAASPTSFSEVCLVLAQFTTRYGYIKKSVR